VDLHCTLVTLTCRLHGLIVNCTVNHHHCLPTSILQNAISNLNVNSKLLCQVKFGFRAVPNLLIFCKDNDHDDLQSSVADLASQCVRRSWLMSSRQVVIDQNGRPGQHHCSFLPRTGRRLVISFRDPSSVEYKNPYMPIDLGTIGLLFSFSTSS